MGAASEVAEVTAGHAAGGAWAGLNRIQAVEGAGGGAGDRLAAAFAASLAAFSAASAGRTSRAIAISTMALSASGNEYPASSAECIQETPSVRSGFGFTSRT